MSLATELCKKTNSHQEWITLMTFGMPTLLKDQEVLMECIFMEAEREARRTEGARFGPSWVMRSMADLGLTIVESSSLRCHS